MYTSGRDCILHVFLKGEHDCAAQRLERLSGMPGSSFRGPDKQTINYDASLQGVPRSSIGSAGPSEHSLLFLTPGVGSPEIDDSHAGVCLHVHTESKLDQSLFRNSSSDRGVHPCFQHQHADYISATAIQVASWSKSEPICNAVHPECSCAPTISGSSASTKRSRSPTAELSVVKAPLRALASRTSATVSKPSVSECQQAASSVSMPTEPVLEVVSGSMGNTVAGSIGHTLGAAFLLLSMFPERILSDE
jgi:hypothetical protein